MPNPFCHIELNTSDTNKAKDFYSHLFNWQFEDMDMGPMGTYSTFKTDKGPGGGLMSMPGAPTAWLPYVAVDDINTATDKAKSLGATIIHGPVEVPNIGWLTIFIDPTGANIGIFQPKTS